MRTFMSSLVILGNFIHELGQGGKYGKNYKRRMY